MQTSVLNRAISVLQSYDDTNPRTENLLNYLNDISKKEEVLKIRAIQDIDTRKTLKAKLPAANISGVFAGRGEKALVMHSKLICIDIDQKDNLHLQDFGELKSVLTAIPYVAYCALSVSGSGYWVIIPISNPKRHKEHFLAIQKTFKTIGINIDPAPSNVASLRGYSYDPSAYFNHRAIEFTYVYDEPKRVENTYTDKRIDSTEANCFDDYNENGEIETLLQAHGWKLEYTKGTKIRYCRPGKLHGVSADYCNERKILFVFTTGSVFDPNKGYNHTGVFCNLECNGDYRRCRERLIEMGYGKLEK